MSHETITSTQNERVKRTVRLRQSKHRRQAARTVIDGNREIAAALAAGAGVREVFYCPRLCDDELSRSLLARCGEIGCELFAVTPPVFEKLAFGDRAEGIVAVADVPEQGLADLPLSDAPLVAILEGFEKPGNVGAVLRSADAAGVDCIIVADGQTDLYNPAAIRASQGAIFSLPVCAASAAQTLDWLRDRSLQMLAARTDGNVDYTSTDMRRPTAFILGAETTGLSASWTADDVTTIRLPLLGTVDSLNVSATAAVLFYEARRQRRR